jgi:hypothetical protein
MQPSGYYEQRCKHCSSTKTVRRGLVTNRFQRCNNCNNFLNIPANAKALGTATIECMKCKQNNVIRYTQRWYCPYGCKRTFIGSTNSTARLEFES